MEEKQLAGSLMQLAKIDKENARRRDQIMISPSVITVEKGFNVRGVALSESEYWAQEQVVEHIDSIAQAYAAGDYIPPLVVQFRVSDQKAVVRDGHHRFKALQLAIERGADIRFVNVTEFKGDEQKQQLLMLKSSNSIQLSPVERAEIYNRLYEWGSNYEEIANMVGMSAAHVIQYMKIYNLPLEKKKLLQLGKLSVNAALSNPKKPKAFAPPKKAVKQVIDLVASAKVTEKGDTVKVEIPKDLWEQFINPEGKGKL